MRSDDKRVQESVCDLACAALTRRRERRRETGRDLAGSHYSQPTCPSIQRQDEVQLSQELTAPAIVSDRDLLLVEYVGCRRVGE